MLDANKLDNKYFHFAYTIILTRPNVYYLSIVNNFTKNVFVVFKEYYFLFI